MLVGADASDASFGGEVALPKDQPKR
jgi:hypothetical protein